MMEQQMKQGAMGDALANKKKGLKLAIMIGDTPPLTDQPGIGSANAANVPADAKNFANSLNPDDEKREMEDIEDLEAIHGMDGEEPKLGRGMNDDDADSKVIDEQIMGMPNKGMGAKLKAALMAKKANK